MIQSFDLISCEVGDDLGDDQINDLLSRRRYLIVLDKTSLMQKRDSPPRYSRWEFALSLLDHLVDDLILPFNPSFKMDLMYVGDENNPLQFHKNLRKQIGESINFNLPMDSDLYIGSALRWYFQHHNQADPLTVLMLICQRPKDSPLITGVLEEQANLRDDFCITSIQVGHNLGSYIFLSEMKNVSNSLTISMAELVQHCKTTSSLAVNSTQSTLNRLLASLLIPELKKSIKNSVDP